MIFNIPVFGSNAVSIKSYGTRTILFALVTFDSRAIRSIAPHTLKSTSSARLNPDSPPPPLFFTRGVGGELGLVRTIVSRPNANVP